MLLAASPSPLALFLSHKPRCSNPRTLPVAVRMASSTAEAMPSPSSHLPPKTLDSHLHVWASPKEAAENYPYFPGQEPSIPGDADFLLKCMSEAGVDGALIVQPVNHMFDHSLVTSVLRRHPSKFVGCCLANPADDGSGIRQLEDLVLKDGYRAVRFNPYLWPPGQKMTNEIGKALFSKAGELGVPVGFMCMKGLSLHISEIEELCESYSSTVVLLDHMGFCKPPLTDEEHNTLSSLLKLSRFPQVYVKFSALFRLSRNQYPYEDTRDILSKVISSFGANHVMWGRYYMSRLMFFMLQNDQTFHIICCDFPFVVNECGYKEAKEAVPLIANHIPLSSADIEWIMGRTLGQLFHHEWQA